MSSKLLAKVATRIASWSGDEARAIEVKTHLAEAEAHGAAVGVLDVGSIATLVVRRAIRDIPFWIAGLPVPLLTWFVLAWTYEGHFHAWDVVGAAEHPRSAASELWQTGIIALGVLGVASGLAAGRLAVRQLQRGNLLAPTALLLALFTAASQSDLFVEYTPWWRDGGLRAEHVNELPIRSVGLFIAFAMIPVAYLLGALFLRARQPAASLPAVAMQEANLDPVALAAAGSPLLFWAAGPFALLVTLTLICVARSFSTRLKLTAMVVILAPLGALVAWGTIVTSSNDDLNPVVVLAVFAMLLALWTRIAVVALKPLRDLRIGFTLEQRR